MNVKFSVIVVYVRLLTLTSSLLVELGFKKLNKEIGTLLQKKELIQVIINNYYEDIHIPPYSNTH